MARNRLKAVLQTGLVSFFARDFLGFFLQSLARLLHFLLRLFLVLFQLLLVHGQMKRGILVRAIAGELEPIPVVPQQSDPDHEQNYQSAQVFHD